MEELIRIKHNGNEYQLFTDEIEAAYLYRKKEYMVEDCKHHLEIICDNTVKDDIDEDRLKSFKEEYGIDYSEAESLIENMVETYEDIQDCNRAENDVWEDAIKLVLQSRLDYINAMEDVYESETNSEITLLKQRMEGRFSK
jgi:hypothetical protein